MTGSVMHLHLRSLDVLVHTPELSPRAHWSSKMAKDSEVGGQVLNVQTPKDDISNARTK